MLVLKILGAITLLVALYFLAIVINAYTEKRYKYLFLNPVTLATSLSGYVSSFVGYKWYLGALKIHGDILNGEILIAIGVGLLLWTIYQNLKNTDFFIGIFFSILQQVLYLVAGAIGLVILFLAFAAFAEAKPVYRID